MFPFAEVALFATSSTRSISPLCYSIVPPGLPWTVSIAYWATELFEYIFWRIFGLILSSHSSQAKQSCHILFMQDLNLRSFLTLWNPFYPLHKNRTSFILFNPRWKNGHPEFSTYSPQTHVSQSLQEDSTTFLSQLRVLHSLKAKVPCLPHGASCSLEEQLLLSIVRPSRGRQNYAQQSVWWSRIDPFHQTHIELNSHSVLTPYKKDMKYLVINLFKMTRYQD